MHVFKCMIYKESLSALPPMGQNRGLKVVGIDPKGSVGLPKGLKMTSQKGEEEWLRDQ